MKQCLNLEMKKERKSDDDDDDDDDGGYFSKGEERGRRVSGRREVANEVSHRNFFALSVRIT